MAEEVKDLNTETTPDTEEVENQDVNQDSGASVDEDDVGDDPVGDTEASGEPEKPASANSPDYDYQKVLIENQLLKEHTKRQQEQSAKEQEEASERNRMSLMTSEERLEYRAQKAEQRFAEKERQFDQKMQFVANDTADRTEFNIKYGSNPQLSKYMGEVEGMYRELVNRGILPKREAILQNIIGRKAIDSLTKGGAKKQKNKAESNVRNATVKSTGSRSDSARPANKSSGNESLRDIEARLAGKSFSEFMN